VGVELVRSLHGVVYAEHANKGIIVSTSKFTKGAKKLAGKFAQLELINANDLIRLCDEYLGSAWDSRLDSILVESKRRAIKTNSLPPVRDNSAKPGRSLRRTSGMGRQGP
jgi:restriction system protein